MRPTSRSCLRFLALAALAATGCATDYGVTPYTEEFETVQGALGNADYGPANWVASPNYTNSSRKPGDGKVKTVVVHTVQGSYNGCISWFKNPKAKVSAHYVVSKTGAVTQMVKEEDIGWHVGSENGYTIGIEHEGYVSDPAYVTPQMLDASAKLTCYLVKKWKLSASKTSIKGHVELPNQTHTDPGKYWPWNSYISKVQSCVNGGPVDPPPNPGKAGCCGIKIATSGSTVIDDKGNDCIQLLGPSDSWWTGTASGYGGSMHYTYTSAKSTAENWARWRLTFAKAGKYKVEAWIPAKNASAKPTYKIKHGSTTSSKSFDQKPLSNVWVDLGTYDFAANCDEYVSVADNTGQAYSKTIQLGVDAIRVTAVTPAPQCPASCDDKNVCTDDKCVGGKCQHTNNTAACSDGNGCTTGEKCAAGKCTGAQAKDCGDGNPCTNDGCSNGACTHANNTAACSDGNACTSGDACSGGKCVGGKGLACDDKNACTDDSCSGGKCVHKDNTATCWDGDACTVGEKCAGGACVGGKPAKDCNDGNPCTADTCKAGKCENAPQVAPCDDGNACTTGDVCIGGQCVAGEPQACSDGNPCTTDSCVAGACLHAPGSGVCDDGDGCTENDGCLGGVCTGTAKACTDANPCTADACQGGQCAHQPLSGGCDDGDACTEGDYCAQGLCLAGKALDCDDGLACTQDACEDGQCSHEGETQAVAKGCQGSDVVETDACGQAKVLATCGADQVCEAGECVVGSEPADAGPTDTPDAGAPSVADAGNAQPDASTPDAKAADASAPADAKADGGAKPVTDAKGGADGVAQTDTGGGGGLPVDADDPGAASGCSAGAGGQGGAAAGLVLLALAVLGWRRRRQA